uniref:programmed cell death protein 2 isoform X3 n=1 Tax=Myxine glutinosa TaxID=7769 RepID=UPI00358FDA81
MDRTRGWLVLGFLERPEEQWRLTSAHFPSKVGGKPAWLALDPLPGRSELACRRCGKPCVFLLQVYAPLSEKEHCFHRVLFFFICQDTDCYTEHHDSSPFIVLRSQLPRINPFYSPDPPVGPTASPVAVMPHLCAVCGSYGPTVCSCCRTRHYCSREHQVIHWRAGHRGACSSQGERKDGVDDSDKHSFLFQEFEIITEGEDEQEGDDEDTDEEEEDDELAEEIVTPGAKSFNAGEDVQDLEAMFRNESKEDQSFRIFERLVAIAPKQVIRYGHGAAPLWVSNSHVPSSHDIPPCSCGAQRAFEFQIMPQLLNDLNVDKLGASIDWGTLAVYTCSQSCRPATDGETRTYSYLPEFVWKQDFVQNNNAQPGVETFAAPTRDLQHTIVHPR